MAKHKKNKFSLGIAVSATLALVLGFVIPQAAVAATSVGPTTSRVVVSPSSTNKLNDVLSTPDDIIISGFGSNPTTDFVRVDITESGGGTLKFTTIAGLTAVIGGNPVNTTTSYNSLEFTASITDANTAIAGIQYLAGAAYEQASVSVVVSYAGTASDLYAFYKGNEHFYKFVSTSVTWSAAKTAAEAARFNGLVGYLATSTSSGENSFITSRVGNNTAWLSGSDSAVEYAWRWESGPEAGKRFFNQNLTGSNGTVYTGDGLNFENFSATEPNGNGAGESYLELLSGGTGKWNDLNSTTTRGYLIEFGGMQADAITLASTSRTITVDVDYPEVKATSGNCVQNIENTTGVTVLDPNGDGSKCVVKFTNGGSTTWRAPTGVTSVQLLVVGGGGAGGTYGGGGAGEFVEKLSHTVSPGAEYPVTIGAGGAVSTITTAGNRGSNSSFDSITAGGGGGGGTLKDPIPRTSVAATTGLNGASSGGSVAGDADSSGVAAVAAIDDSDANSFGSAGGAGYRYGPSNSDFAYAAGGGGGAGGAGGAGTLTGTVVYGGNGGVGKTSTVTGDLYAGGGAGGANQAQTTAYTGRVIGTASHGGGAGAAGAANTGGGGGSTSSTGSAGYAGGSGIVAISYSGTGNPTISTHPADTSKVPLQTATFTVSATSQDSGTLSYQWQVFTTAITATWTDISGATSASYTTGSLALANNGYKYRVNVTNTIGSAAKTVTSNLATLSMSNIAVVDVAWNELNYDYTAGKYIPQVGTGKAVGNKVLFKNVITRDGTCVDSVVTTKTLTSATVVNYETGTGAGGAKTNFEVDIDFAANNAFGEFQYDFFVCGTYDRLAGGGRTEDQALAAATRVELRNLAITLIDIDYYQWNEATGMDSFTLASNTKIKYGPAGTPLANGTTIGTTNGAIASYPADVRFQGPSAIDSTIPEDQAIINYGSIQTFNVKMGRSATGKPNYFGVAFKSLSWGSTTPATQGPATTYTITYDGNSSTSGSAPTSHSGIVGKNFTVSGNTGTFVRTGYSFAGWNTNLSGTGTTYAVGSSIMMPKDGTTLYAVWTASSLALTYDANGGSGAPAAESRTSGSTANLSATTPTRAGFVFAGWNKAANGSSTGHSSGGSFNMPGTATTLYAQWTAATGTVAYNRNGTGSGSVPNSSTGTTGNPYTVLGNTGTLAMNGYTFAGWNTAANGTGTDYAAGNSVNYPATGQTTTLYAQWTANVYSLSYNANGGINSSPAPATQSAAYGANVTLAGAGFNPTRLGYTFSNWNTVAASTGANHNAGATDFSMPAANTVLYAKWTPVDYTLTYDLNLGDSGTGPAAATAKNLGDVFVISATVPTRTSYRFAGWNTNIGGTGNDYASSSSFTMPAADTTLYAKWVAANIKVSYDANGGAGTPPAEQGAQGTGINLSNIIPDKPGYTFMGWCEDLSSCANPMQTNSSYTIPSSNTTLFAKWAAISYTFFYSANGGNAGAGAPASVTGLNVGGLVTVYVVDVNNPAPTKTGYSFTGWNAATDGTSTNYAGGSTYTMGAGNYTIYAQWLGNPFTLTYNSNGGTAISPTSEVRRADSIANITGTSPSRQGFTFSGWNTAANGSGTTYAASGSLTMPAANVILYAQWTAVNNGVSYNANGGSGAPTGANYTFGASVTVSSTTPTRTGYTFTGWNTLQGGGGTPYLAAEVFTMSNTAIVLYAQWTATTYGLDYDANGGTGAPGLSNYAYGSTATVSATLPTRSGYDFQGWNTVQAGTGTPRAAGATFAMPANDVNLYAQWSLATYTVYYNANGGTGSINPQPGRFSATLTLSSSLPTRAGYTFGGWNTSTDASGVNYNSGGSLTLPASNVTLYAKWTATPYTLTYDANGGTGAPAAETNKTVAQIFALAATTSVTRSGYWMTGWNTQADGAGTNYAPNSNFTMPASNLTLYAKWVVEDFTVSYNANGGTGAPAAQSNGGGIVTIPASTASVLRPGYTFSHWYTTPSGTGGTQYAPGESFTPMENIVLYAIWTPRTITVSYDINGGANPNTDKPLPQTATYDGEPIQLAGSGGFSKASSQFLTWNTIADGTGTSYAAEDPNFRVPSSNVTLYAIWAEAFVALEYKPNGGTGAPGDQFAAPGQMVTVAPSEPQKPGYEFVAWSDVKTGNTYSANAPITMPSSNVTLVANWVVRSASVPGGSVDTAKPVIGLTYPKKLNLTVYFKGDRSYLTTPTKLALKKLAATAKKYGYATSITIYGRVKETNDKSYDAKLSKARALNVSAYLKKLGVAGAFKVIAAGISPENKAISRRVDMSLFWTKR